MGGPGRARIASKPTSLRRASASEMESTGPPQNSFTKAKPACNRSSPAKPPIGKSNQPPGLSETRTRANTAERTGIGMKKLGNHAKSNAPSSFRSSAAIFRSSILSTRFTRLMFSRAMVSGASNGSTPTT